MNALVKRPMHTGWPTRRRASRARVASILLLLTTPLAFILAGCAATSALPSNIGGYLEVSDTQAHLDNAKIFAPLTAKTPESWSTKVGKQDAASLSFEGLMRHPRLGYIHWFKGSDGTYLVVIKTSGTVLKSQLAKYEFGPKPIDGGAVYAIPERLTARVKGGLVQGVILDDRQDAKLISALAKVLDDSGQLAK